MRMAEQVAVLAWNHATPANRRKAQRLIDEAGGEFAFQRVIGDTEFELPGVSDLGMRRLRAACELGLAVATECKQVAIVSCSGDVAQLVGPRLRHLAHEEVWIVGLDSRNCVIGVKMVSRGGRHGAALTAKDLLRVAVRLGCDAFVLVHNHPGGDPRPSREDIAMTDSVVKAASAVGICLLDHVVVTRSGHSSMLELGLLDGGRETSLLAAEVSR